MLDSSEKIKQIKAIKNGLGIHHVLYKAYEILENPILIHDMEYKIIDMTRNAVTDDPIWNEYATKNTVSYSWLDFFKNECFLEAAANTKKITFLTSDKLNYNRIFGKLFNKNNIQIGCSVMIACNKPFEEDDPVLFEMFCDKLSKEIGTIDFYNNYGQAYFEQLIAELIVGVKDIAFWAAHMESIYMHLKSNLHLAVVDIGKNDSTYSKLSYFRDLFKKTQPEYAYAIYSNYIIVIVGTNDRVLNIEKDLAKLSRFFNKNNIYAGISKSFENLFELPKYYKEAVLVLNKALEKEERNIVVES